MKLIEIQWISDEESLKVALQNCLNCSGQLLKRHFSSKQLSRPVYSRDIFNLPIDLVNHLLINPGFVGPQAKVLWENENYLAIHKPAGIHSHPLCYSDQDTSINYLAQQGIWAPLEVNKSSYDRGLLYRLDYETSGVLVFAKKNDLFVKLRENFQTQMKRKLYWAIVDGSFDQEGVWQHYFRASGIKGAKQKVDFNPHADADLGILKVVKLLEANGKSLLMIDLKSGLRHQIRAQLAALGFPILGDELYGGKKAERLFLHAWRYEWTETIEDQEAELFGIFFDLNSALEVAHDVLRVFKSI
jgi:23S rRNA pseudouridine1911/1915/1917 synthase